MPPRVPTEGDFADLQGVVPHKLHFPSPPESTTALMLVFHGLGDTERNFSSFASSTNLPGVLALTVRGTARLPAELGIEEGYHWGDDLIIDQSSGTLDSEGAGFNKAEKAILDEVVGKTLVEKLGWETDDIFLFGFGQGGSLALGLAARLAEKQGGKKFKGVVSLGGPLPDSMKSSGKSATDVVVTQVEDTEGDKIKAQFDSAQLVQWDRKGVDMPRDRDEMVPLMKFWSSRLNSGFGQESEDKK